jgi:protein-disulfide isomerase
MTIRLTSLLAGAALLALAACGDKTAEPAAQTAATGTATASSSTDWTAMTAATPEGGFRIGNPDAKVKLVEFASLTCPHCSDFHGQAFETIKSKYVATGNVSYEFRNFVLNGPDYAASMLARCQGAEPFFGMLNAFFTDQRQWTEAFQTISEEEGKRLSTLPQDQQIAALAAAGKLDEYVRTRGIPRAKFDACLADKAALDQLLALRTQATDKYKLTGTPGFIINDVTQEGVFDWATLEPKLKAALN